MINEPESWSRLHPATLAIRAIERLPQLVLGLPAAVYFIGSGLEIEASLAVEITALEIAALLAVIGLFASMLFAYLYWRRFGYWIGEEQLVIKSGILNRNRRTIPFDRIQDISLEQKLLARLFGVEILRIETGGSGGVEDELNCINQIEADRLRDVIRAYRAEQSTSVPGELAEEQPTATIIFSMGMGRLIIDGLFNFSLVFLAILVGAFQYFGGYFHPEELIEAYGEQALGLISVPYIASIVLVLLGIGVITGLVRTIAREFGFCLSRTETGLRRQRGLFTRTDVVIPLKRVQAAILSTSLIKRLFGWHSLSLQSLGSDGDAGTDHVAIPLGHPDEMLPILHEMQMAEPLPVDSYHAVSRGFIWRRWLEAGLLWSAIIIGLSFFWSGWPLLFWAVPFIVIVPVLQYHAHGYCFTDDFLFIRRGILHPRVTILPLANVQTMTVISGLTQRILGISTLAMGTAGASFTTPLRILDLESDLAHAWVERRFPFG